MPFVEAKCTNCGAVLPVDSARDAWVCGYCNTPFIVEKAIQQFNITNNISAGVVNVLGGETADVLYNRALEWLKLNNEEKALSVLRGMIDKYPGDRRGWQKLDEIVDRQNREAQEAVRKKEAASQAICDEIRNGHGEKWATWVAENIFARSIDYSSFPSKEQLKREGQENVRYLNDLLMAVGMPRKANGEIKQLPSNHRLMPGIYREREQYMRALPLALGVGGKLYHYQCIFAIIGNLVLRNDDGTTIVYVSNKILTKPVLQQAILEAGRAVQQDLCLSCGRAKVRKHLVGTERYCPVCYPKQK